MIRSFANTHIDTERVWDGLSSRKLPREVQQRALAKLRLLNAATALNDLRNPPGNRLHPLAEDRVGQHSVSINDKYRICFAWKDGDAHDVEIVDYH